MTQLVHLGRVGVLATRPVVQYRAVLPGVPEPGDHVHEFVRAVVALVVAQVGVDAEVLRLTVVDRCDHVPGRPTAGQVVQRGESPRDMERRVVGGRVRCAEPDLGGGLRQHPEHHPEVQLDRPRTVVDGLGHRPAVDAWHRQAVVEEHQVEAALFELAADLGVVRRVEIAVFGRRMAPGTGIYRGTARLHERDQGHLVFASISHEPNVTSDISDFKC